MRVQFVPIDSRRSRRSGPHLAMPRQNARKLRRRHELVYGVFIDFFTGRLAANAQRVFEGFDLFNGRREARQIKCDASQPSERIGLACWPDSLGIQA